VIVVAQAEMTSVLRQVASWPEQDRVVLARTILATVESATPDTPRGYSADEVIALLKLPQPAPSDIECRQILEEELLRKHGS
jgi:hypothetical protein